MDVISEVFFPVDVERIKNIPVSNTGCPYERVWIASEDGVFRVRDMYSLALRNQSETSSSNGGDTIWKNIWRASWDILPHGISLCKKGIENVGNCQRCGSQEDNSHVLKDCSWAKQVWLKMMSSSDIPQQGSFCEWLGKIIEQKNQKEVELFSVCAWQIWCARNDLYFENLYVSPELCFKRAKDMLSEYRKANIPEPKEHYRRQKARWVPLDHDTIKINVCTCLNYLNS